ncbi:hypothetical protein GCM10020001_114950 [Nonomuraea salmonea]
MASSKAGAFDRERAGVAPLIGGRKPTAAVAALWVFVLVPFAALAAAVPVAWGWGLSWTDVAIAAAAYILTGLGVTVGFHRHLTHGAFKARRWLRIALAVAGSLAVQGSVIQWVADHRRHHAFTDRDGDPHSPWRYGHSVRGLAKGLVFAHVGWMLGRDLTNRERFAKDLLNDADIGRVDRLFGPLVAASLLLPPAAGLLVTGTWQGAATAFFWGLTGTARAAPPRHLVDQLRLPRLRRAAAEDPCRGPGGELLATGDPVVRRELAQRSPRRPHLRPPRRTARPDRHLRPADQVAGEAGLGGRRTLADPCPSGRAPPRALLMTGPRRRKVRGRQGPDQRASRTAPGRPRR